MSEIEPTVRETRYEVSLLPEDNINAHTWMVAVEYRGRGRWAVLHHGYCLGTDGEWSYESMPSGREDEWLAMHRFDLDTALRLAKEHAPKLTINGMTAADVLARTRKDNT